ncbi:cobyrinate a,c-diamide synthase [Aquihabitans daechungensis]|uniref:cobyrinate a,c-diamide synthase n=1 Tax=Aquihabitans daechungensis TaxID=1052257 RepID=UPI003BA21EA5
MLGPRVVVAGTHSGAGKTTVATGLMAALRRRGTVVGSAKVGPDFIDPGYHELATGRPGRNLDPWMCGADLVAPLAARAAAGTDVLVVEGVMGLFDGAADGSPSSTADVAVALDAPVLLVVDCSSQAASVAALVHGFATFDPRVRIAGVVLNRLASDSHEAMVRAALAAMDRPVPVVGALRRDPRLAWRDRHLGLIPVAEHPDDVGVALDALAELVAASCDLEQVVRIARTAPDRSAADVPMPRPAGAARVAVAGGRAFTFQYPDNLEALAAAGAELVPFDPLVDEALPADIDGLVIGGGFPEVMAGSLGANEALRRDVAARRAAGLVTWAECGGLLWLARSLDGHPMVGAVPVDAAMTERLTLGYRTARQQVATPLGPVGTVLRGHEFHYTATDPPGAALQLTGRTGTAPGGFATPTLLASYLHVHLAGQPALAEAFVATATPART